MLARFQKALAPYATYLFCVGVAVTILAPIGALVYSGLSAGRSYDREIHLTLENYYLVFSRRDNLVAIENSIVIACLVTLIAVPIGTLMAWIVSRTNIPLKSHLELVIISTFLFSPFTIGIAWEALLAQRTGMLNIFLKQFGIPSFNVASFSGIVVVMGLWAIPYAYLLTRASLSSMDPALEDASRISGAGAIKTARHITLPLVSPAILSSIIVVFVVACGHFSIPMALGGGRTPVLATKIYSEFVSGSLNIAGALGTVLLGLTMALTFFQWKILGKRTFAVITGKGYRPSPIDLGKLRYLCLALILSYVTIGVMLPYLALGIASFLPTFNFQNLSAQSFTLQNWQAILGLEGYALYMIESLRNSFLFASIAAVSIVVLSVAISYIVFKTSIPARKMLDMVSMLPLAVPSAAFGIGMIWLWIPYLTIPIYGTMWIIIMAWVIAYLPYGVRTISSSMRQISNEMEESARVFGASKLQTIMGITIPLIKMGVLNTFLLTFILLFREVQLAVLLNSPGNTTLAMSLLYFSDFGQYSLVAAFGFFQSMIILAVVLAVRKVIGTEIML